MKTEPWKGTKQAIPDSLITDSTRTCHGPFPALSRRPPGNAPGMVLSTDDLAVLLLAASPATNPPSSDSFLAQLEPSREAGLLALAATATLLLGFRRLGSLLASVGVRLTLRYLRHSHLRSLTGDPRSQEAP